MYPSDYTYTNRTKGWLWLKYPEWFISPERNSDSYCSWYIFRSGGTSYAVINVIKSLRPAFYLKANTQYKSGIGTKENPYRLFI